MKKRIYIIADNPKIITGYARVGRFIAKSLHEGGYEVIYLPCNADAPDCEDKYLYEVLPFDPGDRYWINRMVPALRQLPPSLLLCIGEFSYVGHVGTVCRDLGVQSLYYFPVEGKYYPPAEFYAQGVGKVDVRMRLVKFNHIVAYSDFGKTEINRLLPGIVTDVIPHAVNTEIFRPLDKETCLRVFIPKVVDHHTYDKLFIVGAAYRNHRRKGIPHLLKAFKHFIDNYENKEYKTALLFMVMDQKDPYGYHLENLIERYGLKGRVILAPQFAGREGLTDHGLCEVYNSFDVHVCPFLAEGFGYSVIEPMACGIRTIATNYATPAEYGKDVLHFVEPEDLIPELQSNCEWAVIDYKKFAVAINEEYLACKHQTDQKAVERAVEFSEPLIAKKWVDLIGRLKLPEITELRKAEEAAPQTNSVDDYLNTMGE
jgi:glycosyltransferase involved in cell wall biosynthesis